MAISFLIQSTKNPAPIYVRVRQGKKIDAKAKTGKFINPDNFKKGKVKTVRIPSKADAKTKKRITQYNSELGDLKTDLTTIENKISNAINAVKEYETINSKWLKSLLHPEKQSNIPDALTDYFDYYRKAKRTSLKHSTIKKIKVFKSRVENYEKTHGKVYIQDVNKKFKHKICDWCDIKGYAHNTKLQTLKVVLTVCNHARERGVLTHPELQDLTKGLQFKPTEHIHLNFKELEKIANQPMPTERLETARDWLIISCYTAQRVSDFLRFSKEDVINIEGMDFLDIKQEKTDAPVYIPLSGEVVKVLNKRNGEFPPIFSKNAESNKAMYNILIKEVCKIAGIENTVTANLKNKETNRYETHEMPKYKAVSTHIGRRSFATNYYGKIKTSLLISATGHASERQFLRYVGKTGTTNALELARAMRKLSGNTDNAPMKLIKNASNQN